MSSTVPSIAPRLKTSRARGSALLLAALLAACTDKDRTSRIPSHALDPPAPGFMAAADSGRVLARAHMASRYLAGVSVAVGRNGELVWAEGFGWADLSDKTLATPETLYPVGSISKPLTTTAAGLLHEQGQLDFDLVVQEYLPDFPEKRWPFTTAQLMGHIAGIHNYGVREALRQAHCYDAHAGLAVIEGDTLLHEPGSEFEYSNYGFRLVGAVVEAAAGEPYLDFMKREVLGGLGLGRTIPDEGPGTSPDRATFYDDGAFNTRRRAQDVDMSCSMPAGGFLSTPTDLVRFGFAMLNTEFLEQETVDLLWTPQRLNSGAPTSYGMGWQIGRTTLGDDNSATPMIGHGGAVLGGGASLMIFPEEDMVVATMTNTSADVAGLTGELAAIFRDSGMPH